MSRSPRTEPIAIGIARSRAHIDFLRARRDMLQALRVWMTCSPDEGTAQDEADSTASAVRQIVAVQR